MRKFSQINESNTTVELSTNKKDFIKNLINESLSVENGEIKGKETLAKTINKIIDTNDSKTIIKVLESIKMRSFHTLNLEWINEAIVAEKKKMCSSEKECDCDEKAEKHEKEKEEDEVIEESLNESVQDDVQAQFDEIPEEIAEEDEVQHEFEEEEEEEEEEGPHDDIKDELEEIKELEVEILDKLDKVSPADDFEDPIEDEEAQEEVQEIQEEEEECEDCEDIEDMFVEESTSYLKDINDLRLIMESINSGLITEDHIEDKKGQLNFIISKLTDKKLEKVILEKISKLPSYIKTADIEETLTNLSDKEVKDLYLAVEKAK